MNPPFRICPRSTSALTYSASTLVKLSIDMMTQTGADEVSFPPFILCSARTHNWHAFYSCIGYPRYVPSSFFSCLNG
jgi:hypothetical protein